jgi:hypothetical protein
MGAKFYFFTDPALLQAQPDLPASGQPAPGQLAYGPALPSGGKDRFRITDRHNFASSGAPVVAICDGVLCAQEDDQGALTLILKPSQAPPFESPVVSYFIYKGVDKGSLLNPAGNQILDEGAAAATEFTTKIAKEWKKQNPNLVGSRAALGLDRDATFQHDDGTTKTSIFTGDDPVERLFSYPHKTMQLPTVAAGDVIGSFKTDAGFEIVLQRLGYALKLALARLFENYISVPSLSADNGGTPWQADDSAYFEHWHSKEQVLAYMDPCAYFGSFVQAALYKKSGGNESKINGSNVYPEILKKFANRNIAWLDIRNNYSTSYNLFGLYGDAIRFVSHSDATLINGKNFRAGSWPILQLRIADVPGSKRGSLHRTRLRLPVGKSSAPAVLVSKGFVKHLGPEKPKYKAPPIAADSADPAFYLPVRLAFPVTQDGTPNKDVFSCSYTRVNIYEKPHAATQPAAPLNIAGKEYLDGVFRLRDLQLDTDYAGNNLRFRIYPEDVLVDLEGRYGPTYSAAVGIAQDADNVTLFAFPNYFLPNTYGPKDQQPLPSWADASSGDAQDFLSKLATTFQHTTITKKTITPDGASNDVDTLIVRHEPSVHHNAATDKSFLEHYCLLLFPKLDHQALLAELAADTGANVALPAFLAVSASTAKHDAVHNVDYVEVALQSTGFATSGSKAARHATPLTKKVYEYANA